MYILETRLKDNSIRAFKGPNEDSCIAQLNTFRKNNPWAESVSKQVILYKDQEYDINKSIYAFHYSIGYYQSNGMEMAS